MFFSQPLGPYRGANVGNLEIERVTPPLVRGSIQYCKLQRFPSHSWHCVCVCVCVCHDQAPTVPKTILARCGMLRHAAACCGMLEAVGQGYLL